jgi:hypothetical protein
MTNCEHFSCILNIEKESYSKCISCDKKFCCTDAKSCFDDYHKNIKSDGTLHLATYPFSGFKFAKGAAFISYLKEKSE